MTDRELTQNELALIDAERRRNELGGDKLELEIARMKQVDRFNDASSDEHHIYTLWGAVNSMSCAHALANLGQWSREAPGCAMTVVFNSPGGGVIDGLALYDFIQELRAKGHHVTTVTLGMAASMGGVLLQAGDHRVAGKNAFILIHEVSSGTMGKMTELEDEVKFYKRLQEKLVDILAQRSTLTTRQIKTKWERRDWWLDAEEALRLGFIDEIRTVVAGVPEAA